MEKPDQPLSRSIQEFVPGKQVTLAHLIAHPTDDLAKKIGVPGAEAIGIMTLTPGETAMIAGDIATKAADVQIGFLDRFTGSLVVHGKVGAVEEALTRVVEALERAVELEPIPQTLTVLAEAYDSAKQPELAATLREKAARMLVPDETAPATAAPRKQRRPRQPRKIIM